MLLLIKAISSVLAMIISMSTGSYIDGELSYYLSIAYSYNFFHSSDYLLWVIYEQKLISLLYL